MLQPVDPENIEVLPMTRQLLWLVARTGSPGTICTRCRSPDLAKEPFVFYGESLALNDVVLSACRTAGFTPTIVGRSGHWDFMAALVLAGVGIALLPAPYCRRLDPAQFTCRPVVEPEIQWEMAIGWRRNGYLSHAARAWLEVAREALPGQAGDDFMLGPGIGMTRYRCTGSDTARQMTTCRPA